MNLIGAIIFKQIVFNCVYGKMEISLSAVFSNIYSEHLASVVISLYFKRFVFYTVHSFVENYFSFVFLQHSS